MTDQNQTVQEFDRASIANEVWEESAGNPPGESSDEFVSHTDAHALPATQEVDPWAGIPPAIRDEIMGLRSKVESNAGLEVRLKQAESRIGGVLNELHAAKEAAKSVANAPSKEQIAEAAASQDHWDSLKEDFPDWTRATESRLAAERAEILKHVPSAESIRQELREQNALEMAEAKAEMAGNIVAFKHPDWIATRDSPDFRQWNETHSRGKRDSNSPHEVIAILDEYAAHKATRKSTRDIAAERNDRLQGSQVPAGRRSTQQKSEADMSKAELRASVASEVWKA
jgi:hypothetical protein